MRKRVAVLLGLLAAMLCFGAVANAGIITPTKVSASVSPHHRLGAPYNFVVRGSIRFPKLYCPPGTTNPAYCTIITNAHACRGKVSLTVDLGKDPILAAAESQIASTEARVSQQCTYKIRLHFPESDFTATHRYVPHEKGSYVKVRFHVKFLGNTVLNAKGAKTQKVVAKLTQP
ncbi:MAG: hypothetical protein M3065_17445 [Actinomycetota bacterium]|nr:hypothetical protein [Actinomycetota bacterium]